MKVLRKECPWDAEQTITSLRRYTLEETHEVLEAIDIADATGDWQPLKTELGDLLLQVAFYACLANEADAFDLGDVIDTLIEKMIYRHPHVFAQTASEDISRQWNELKDVEHKDRQSLMDGIPPLPALQYAQKQQQRAARVGFDWHQVSDVMLKMREELDELEVEVRNGADRQRIEDEFGDVLFTLANLARKLDLDAELSLMHTNRKFGNRFRAMEALAASRELDMSSTPLDELEELYQEAKASLGE